MLLNFLLGQAYRRWMRSLEEAARQQEASPESAARDFEPTVREVDEYSLVAESLSRHPEEAPDPEPEWVFPRVQRTAMGSLWEIYLAGTDREQLTAAGEQALDEIDRLDRQLSHYKEDSDITRLASVSGKQWVRLEPKLYFLLKRCADLFDITGGAFDVTTGPLTRAWGFFKGEKRIPSEEEISAVMENVGTQRILFDDDNWLVFLPREGMEINLGAIGKGYAIDEAAKTLRFYNVEHAVLHGGQSTIYAMGSAPADVAISDHPSPGSGWPFEIKDPRDKTTVIETVHLRDEAISTSGSYEDYFEVDGARYSHIIDPRTGYPAQGMLSVSVIAPSAADSDAFSTAFFVMGRESAQEFCRSHPELRVIIMELGSDNPMQVTRIGFPDALDPETD